MVRESVHLRLDKTRARRLGGPDIVLAEVGAGCYFDATGYYRTVVRVARALKEIGFHSCHARLREAPVMTLRSWPGGWWPLAKRDEGIGHGR